MRYITLNDLYSAGATYEYLYLYKELKLELVDIDTIKEIIIDNEFDFFTWLAEEFSISCKLKELNGTYYKEFNFNEIDYSINDSNNEYKNRFIFDTYIKTEYPNETIKEYFNENKKLIKKEVITFFDDINEKTILTLKYVYDEYGNLIKIHKITENEDIILASYFYEKRYVKSNYNKVLFEYNYVYLTENNFINDDYFLTLVKTSAGKDCYNYDEKLNLSSIDTYDTENNINSIVIYNYDVNNNLISTEIKMGEYKDIVNYEYDINNNCISEKYNMSNLIINYIYNGEKLIDLNNNNNDIIEVPQIKIITNGIKF